MAVPQRDLKGSQCQPFQELNLYRVPNSRYLRTLTSLGVLSPPHSSLKSAIITPSPFHREGKRGAERLSRFPKAIQQVLSRFGTEAQVSYPRAQTGRAGAKSTWYRVPGVWGCLCGFLLPSGTTEAGERLDTLTFN